MHLVTSEEQLCNEQAHVGDSQLGSVFWSSGWKPTFLSSLENLIYLSMRSKHGLLLLYKSARYVLYSSSCSLTKMASARELLLRAYPHSSFSHSALKAPLIRNLPYILNTPISMSCTINLARGIYDSEAVCHPRTDFDFQIDSHRCFAWRSLSPWLRRLLVLQEHHFCVDVKVGRHLIHWAHLGLILSRAYDR